MNNVKLGSIDNAKSFGKTLRLLRTERDEDLRTVAEAIGISHTRLSFIERNLASGTVSLDTLMRLLDYYGVQLKLEEVES